MSERITTFEASGIALHGDGFLTVRFRNAIGLHDTNKPVIAADIEIRIAADMNLPLRSIIDRAHSGLIGWGIKTFPSASNLASSP